MKKNRLLFALCAGFFSCMSIQQPSHVYSRPDYTAEDVRKEEIKRIDALREQNTVEALWRAKLLDDAETIAVCEAAVVAEYQQDLEEEKWYEARRLYRSLAVAQYKDIASLVKQSAELDALTVADVPGLANVAARAERRATYISGTVTIWVDRGLKVQNGVGFADRVIGSGFFISKDGYIVTNHHVIEDLVNTKYKGYARLYIKLSGDSDTRLPAKVVGWDPVVDLALIKAEVDAPYVFSLGSSEDLHVGDRIYAIGSPIGLESTLTSGIVSSVDRKLLTVGNVIQIDAAINSGNSGGPCIDEHGAVQAIAFAGMLQYEGLNFAIPVEYLKAVLPALYSGGKYEHPWLCAYGHTRRDMGKDAGLAVQYVMPGGSLSRAGLQEGDVITAMNGQPVDSLEAMQRLLFQCSAKMIVEIQATGADGEEKSVFAYLAERPKNPGYRVYQNDILAHSFVPIFGMKLVRVSTASSRKYAVQSVIRGSVADESGFSENDPVDIQGVEFNEDNSVIFLQAYVKNSKKGYLDRSVGMPAPLDSPYYF
ncbi:MAG: S1C family serine protease [Treponemataceae bacterium]|nr:S1C family serine protease [Treponemataceae bacterium]